MGPCNGATVLGAVATISVLIGLASAQGSPAPATAVARQSPSPTASTATAGAGNSTGSDGLLNSFVARSGTRFVVQSEDGADGSCQTFYFAGANAYYLMVRAADPATRGDVLTILDSAQELGLTVLRTWAFSDGPLQYNGLQRYPGQYDEATLSGMDFVLNEASKRGIRLVLVFANYWSHYGGIDQYNIWSYQAGAGTCNGDSACRDEFWTDPMAAQYYRDHVSTLLNRRNTLNGRLYREDPAIFGYNLMNEPRSQNELYIIQRITTDDLALPYNISYNQGNDLQQWIENMAGYIKGIDPVHLLTIGSEGFAGNYTPMYLYANPGAWGSLLGVDFVRNHQIKGIDYATMHVYIDQWYCVAEGADVDGQLEFMQNWVDAHQQAAEEDLQMPVVLEEFGSKLDARAGQFKLAYDSCLESARREGSCAGVMFWDLTHPQFAPVDPWLDGVLRYGGGYSNWLPSGGDSDRQEVLDLVSNYAKGVAEINQKSAGTGTCVWSPPPKMGLGCKNLDVQLKLGGLPWTCLQGEPTGLNWCNAADGADVYKQPPAAWESTNGRDLPYNTIELLILGNLTNNGSAPINLQNSWLIVPYSMGIQTEYEGVWQRIEDPNEYFTVYCWAIHGGGQYDLCQNGVDVSFTNFTWPQGTKYDRGVNISFTADITLQPGQSLSGAGGDSSVMLSFKDATHAFRMDVSDTGIDGSLSCPEDAVIQDWPPAPPPAPKPCSAGSDPFRGCPHLDWYFDKPVANATVATSSIAGRRHMLQSDDPSERILTDPPVEWANPGPVPGNPANKTVKADRGVFSVSPSISAADAGFPLGQQVIVTAKIAASGTTRTSEAVSETKGTSVASDTPHPDATGGGGKVLGTQVFLVMSFLPPGFTDPQYKVLAASSSVDGQAQAVRGVIELDGNFTNVQFFAESPYPSIKLTLTDLVVTQPAAVGTNSTGLPQNITDEYSPCVLPQDNRNDAVYTVSLPRGTDDVLDTTLCSPGGYLQVLRVYANGKLVSRTDEPGQAVAYNITGLKVTGGTTYVFVLDGSTGDPYGNYRGQPGLRFKWQSGRAFEGKYDAAPQDITDFVRAQNGQLMKGCNREVYVGCNTWDLMDKSRYPSERGEVMARMDAMVKAGWKVGRTWGFSLGTGTGDGGGVLGETVLDPSSTLETAPGVYNEEIWESLDFVLDEASKRNLSLIIPIEDYWLSIDRYINWSDTATDKNDFYIDWTIRDLYKNHLTTYVNRKNSINGKVYKEDPTIYAWDLLNEPRCTGCGWALQAWVEEMAVFMKAIDPNHMLGIGVEGFYGTTCDRVYLNPGAGERRTGISSSPWASQEGQDFLTNNVVPDIDFATVHIWMDNWMGYADFSTCILCDNQFDYTHGGQLWMEKLDYTRSWITAHLEDAAALGKPMLVEEFGKAVSAAKVYTGQLPHSPLKGETVATNNSIRDIFFETVYGLVSESAQSNGPAQGSNFWNLYTVGIADDDPFKVTLEDTSTMDIIKSHMQNMTAVAARPGVCPDKSATTASISVVAPQSNASADSNTTSNAPAKATPNNVTLPSTAG